MIKLYTIGCGRCNVLEKKLNMKGIEFDLIDDNDKVIKAGEEYGISTAPILVVDDNVMTFEQANKWIAGI